MRFTSLFIIASTLLSIVFALPVPVTKGSVSVCLSCSFLYYDAYLFGTSSSKCSTDVGSDVIPSLARRFEVESDELLDRDISDLFRRAKKPREFAQNFHPVPLFRIKSDLVIPLFYSAVCMM
jgi:hypothetical protein